MRLKNYETQQFQRKEWLKTISFQSLVTFNRLNFMILSQYVIVFQALHLALFSQRPILILPYAHFKHN